MVFISGFFVLKQEVVAFWWFWIRDKGFDLFGESVSREGDVKGEKMILFSADFSFWISGL